jgi:hypothetical protein
MAAPTNAASEDSPCQPGAVHTWPNSEVAAHLIDVRSLRRGGLDLHAGSASFARVMGFSSKSTLIEPRLVDDRIPRVSGHIRNLTLGRTAARLRSSRQIRRDRAKHHPIHQSHLVSATSLNEATSTFSSFPFMPQRMS